MVLRVIVFYVLTWFFILVIGALQQEAGLPAELTVLFQWAPGIAGLLTMLIFRKRDRVRITFVDPEMPLRQYLLAALLPLGSGLLVFMFARIFLGNLEAMPFTVANVGLMIAGAVGEEVGWRGYLHKRIAPHMRGLTSSALVGVLWALFHVQYYGGGFLFMAFMALAFISFTIMAYTALAEYQFNVLGATVFHLAINFTAMLYAGLVQRFSLPFAVAYGLIAVLIAAAVVGIRRDLFFSKLSRAKTR